MDVVDLPLAGLKLIKPKVFADDRGFFLESYRKDLLAEVGVAVEFVQDNHSRSIRHTIRGLHFQRASARSPGQAKLVGVAAGTIFDVAVDLRRRSPTFGRWHGEILDDQSHGQLFIPVGFAHGFCVLSESADVLYKVTSIYDAPTEAGFAFDDPDVGVAWPVGRGTALLSKRDETALRLRDVDIDGEVAGDGSGK
jgi:dTDP-4-dehydrorhamnose 3,5-epimerase